MYKLLVNAEEEQPKTEAWSLSSSLIAFVVVFLIFGLGSPILLLWTNQGTLQTLSVQDWLSLYLSSALLITFELTLGIPGVRLI